MYSTIKKYMIGEALENTKTVFDASKLELVLNIIAIYIPLYIIGTIPVLIGKYGLIMVLQVVGFAFIVAMAISLKRTQSIRYPRIIWFYQGVFFTMASALLNQGEASFITFAFAMVNVVISFLMLGRFLRNIAIWYYSIFIIIAVSISLGLLPKIILPFDLSREIEFFHQPNTNAVLIALTMIAYIVDRFIRSHIKAGRQVLDQKEKLVEQKEAIEKKNETMRSSIVLASKLQKQINIPWSDIDTHFSSYFHFHLPKEKLSGEFFWVQKKDDAVFFALVDTGEVGVPGAMFSYMVRNALGQTLKQNSEGAPKAILRSVNSFLNNSALTNNGFETNVKITLCKYSYLSNELHVVGVSQPIIVEMNGKLKTFFPKNHNLNYLDGETQFDEVKINLAHGDIIYLFSDGIADGIQREAGKAIDYSDFKTLLYNSNNVVFENRNRLISDTYTAKKKNGLQVDDITIVGLKI